MANSCGSVQPVDSLTEFTKINIQSIKKYSNKCYIFTQLMLRNVSYSEMLLICILSGNEHSIIQLIVSG